MNYVKEQNMCEIILIQSFLAEIIIIIAIFLVLTANIVLIIKT